MVKLGREEKQRQNFLKRENLHTVSLVVESDMPFIHCMGFHSKTQYIHVKGEITLTNLYIISLL